jgi:hypothetical protein
MAEFPHFPCIDIPEARRRARHESEASVMRFTDKADVVPEEPDALKRLRDSMSLAMTLNLPDSVFYVEPDPRYLHEDRLEFIERLTLLLDELKYLDDQVMEQLPLSFWQNKRSFKAAILSVFSQNPMPITGADRDALIYRTDIVNAEKMAHDVHTSLVFPIYANAILLQPDMPDIGKHGIIRDVHGFYVDAFKKINAYAQQVSANNAVRRAKGA